MPSLDDDRARYAAALHAVQSGVAAKMHYDPAETSPKHLRVGVNSAMVEMAAMVRLLIARGVFTEEEYTAAMADAAEEEKASYERWLSEQTGARIVLQ